MSGRKPFALYRCVETKTTHYLSVWAHHFSVQFNIDERCAATNICRAVRRGGKFKGLHFKKVKR